MKNKTMRKSDISLLILSLMIITSSMFVLQIANYTLFLWMQIAYVIFMCLFKKKIRIHHNTSINLIFVSLFFFFLMSQLSSMPDSYKKTAIIMPLMLLPLYFSTAFIERYIKRNPLITSKIVHFFKIGIGIQIIWFAFQIVAYSVFHMDINKTVFVDMLHLVDNASFIRNWTYYPSGLSWHSATLAPLFVLGIIIFDNLYIRIIIIIEAVLCGNATTFIGVLLCVVMMLGYSIFFEKHHWFTQKALFSFIAVVALIPVIIYVFNVGELVTSKVVLLWSRLFGLGQDSSSAAHLAYFSDYFSITKRSSFIQVLFGYGYGCSGFPITQIYNRYASLTNWSIECDVIDILVARGIVGFLIYYGFLINILIKGMKIDYRYVVLMSVILFQGLGYNIQFDYVFLLEIVLYICIKYRINFFETTSRKMRPVLNHSKVKYEKR